MKMAKKFSVILISFLILLFTPLISFAQEEPASSGVARPDIYPIPPSEPGFLGQDHSYSVTFRGNGEAVIALKVILNNKAESPLKEISLRVPLVEPREISVYQVIREPSCIRYLTDGSCAESQEPDYYGYYWSKTKYQKAQSEFSGDSLKITLPQAISANKSGSYFVYFRAVGYAKKDIFGSYKFTLESLKVDDSIRNLTVGINTDSDLFLRGAQGKVQYRFQDAATSLKAVGGAAPAESGAIDTFYNQIGYGEITKTASSLAPLESYTVSSSFADSRMKLYAKEISIALGVFLAIVAGVFVAIKLILGKIKAKTGEEKTLPGLNARFVIESLGVSFGSALLVAGYTLFAVWLITYFSRTIGYEFQGGFSIFMVVVSFAIYTLFLFAPGIYLGAKRGIGWGIATVFFTVFWLVILLGIGLLAFFLLRNPVTYPTPMPLSGEVKQY